MSELKNSSEKEQKVKTLRTDDETFDKFKKLASDEFGNQGQCLSALINLYETENAKAVLVDRKLEIESFQDYINKISNLFVTSLQLNADAEGRIREEFARQLDSKDLSIESLQEKVNQLKDENQKAKTSLVETNDKFKELEKINESLEKDKKNLEGLVSKNDELLTKNKDEIANLVSLVNEYKSHKNENVELLSQIETLKQQLQEEKNLNKSNELEINSLNKEIAGLNEKTVELKDEIKDSKAINEKVRLEHKQELSAVEDKFNARLNKEIESIKASFEDKLEVEKRSLSLTVKSVENEKAAMELSYKQQINDYESRINKYESKVNDQESMIAALISDNENPDLLKKLGFEK